ncbi:DUF2007 domain-containing protein [Thioalkalivibrio sulfidiphilus]|uniref:putative signal transducing protein n=1 Tax=Thioalkalivibrio sulfidiphilus TaxID=1033854 RepID=UPI00035E045E|nr:DUF2007 domain-containing protein [Thioalkalivibrio sulfidiphilus]
MKRVFFASDPAAAGFIQGVLENEGIQCMVKNRLLFGASGELPPTECWPEVWVMEDGDEDRAREIIEAVTAAGDEGPGWTCPGCGEQLEPVFTQCWNCGRERG